MEITLDQLARLPDEEREQCLNRYSPSFLARIKTMTVHQVQELSDDLKLLTRKPPRQAESDGCPVVSQLDTLAASESKTNLEESIAVYKGLLQAINDRLDTED